LTPKIKYVLGIQTLKKDSLNEFLQNRQILFLFLVLFLYRPACIALIVFKTSKAAGSNRLRLFCLKFQA